jgi:hypothetical protein
MHIQPNQRTGEMSISTSSPRTARLGQSHLIRATVTLAVAFTAGLSAAAWADPAPLAKSEATIAANSRSNITVRPNPDEQATRGATASPGPCSEVCSGGAGSYGAVSQHSTPPDESGATLPHDPRPRWLAAPSLYGIASPPPAVVRVVTHNGGFHWNDAGIGAAAAVIVIGIGVAGISSRRWRQKHVARRRLDRAEA